MNPMMIRLDINDENIRKQIHASAVKVFVEHKGGERELHILTKVNPKSGVEVWDVKGKCSELAAGQMLLLLLKTLSEEPEKFNKRQQLTEKLQSLTPDQPNALGIDPNLLD